MEVIPPLEYPFYTINNFLIYHTNDYRAWTVTLARNEGVRISKGDFVLLTDIDHILTEENIMKVYNNVQDRMYFIRYFGLLLGDGTFTQDVDSLLAYGLDPQRVMERGLKAPFHGDSFAIRKELFWEAGGYSPTDIETYPPMGETHFRNAYRKLQESGRGTTDPVRPDIYLTPNGYYCRGDVNYNPFGLFHNLSRNKADYPNPRKDKNL